MPSEFCEYIKHTKHSTCGLYRPAKLGIYWQTAAAAPGNLNVTAS